MNKTLRVLVVDDIDANRLLICRFIATLGHQAFPASDGLQAVEACRAQRPDLVLMDIMMPVMNGYAAAAEIRKLCGAHWLPIIFLSAKSSEAEQLEGLEISDDYLVKPVNLTMLGARIQVMTRIAEMQQRIAENAERLETYRQNNERDLQFSRYILDHIIGHSNTRTGPVKRWIVPARHLSGDVVAFGYSPAGTINLLIADSTGHGLAAAISALPVVDTFQTMTRRGYHIAAIAREINDKLHRLLPVSRFVAAALVSIDPYRERIDVWNGGIPEVLYVNNDGDIARQWSSRHPPLGILSPDEFDASPETWQWAEEGEIFVCSDGIIDAENERGEPFGSAALRAAISDSKGLQPFAAVVDAVYRHMGARDNHDDLSLASIACNGNLHQAGRCERDGGIESPQLLADNWALVLRFAATDIRKQTVLPTITRWLNQAGLNPDQFGQMLLIATELCNNAIDHGILGLDSALKQAPEGFAIYHQRRLAALAGLASGHIEIRLERLQEGSASLLRLHVKDDGPGFDHARTAALPAPDDRLPHGRGIALVRQIAMNLRYQGGGSEAIVDFFLAARKERG